MKRPLCFLAILMLFALPLTLPVIAGHAVLGNGHQIECDCTPPDHSYICLDDSTNQPLPDCVKGGVAGRRGHHVK
jgi:hypothetical protein